MGKVISLADYKAHRCPSGIFSCWLAGADAVWWLCLAPQMAVMAWYQMIWMEIRNEKMVEK